jgi:hypothetical protein
VGGENQGEVEWCKNSISLQKEVLRKPNLDAKNTTSHELTALHSYWPLPSLVIGVVPRAQSD